MDEPPESNREMTGNCLIGTIIGVVLAFIIFGGLAYLVFLR